MTNSDDGFQVVARGRRGRGKPQASSPVVSGTVDVIKFGNRKADTRASYRLSPEAKKLDTKLMVAVHADFYNYKWTVACVGVLPKTYREVKELWEKHGLQELALDGGAITITSKWGCREGKNGGISRVYALLLDTMEERNFVPPERVHLDFPQDTDEDDVTAALAMLNKDFKGVYDVRAVSFPVVNGTDMIALGWSRL